MTAKPNTAELDLQLVVTRDNWLDQIIITAELGHAIGVALSTDQAIDELLPQTVISAAFDLTNKFERIETAAKIGRRETREPTIDSRIFDDIQCVTDRGKAVGLTLSTEEVVDTLNPELIRSIAYDLASKFKEIEQLMNYGMKLAANTEESAQ